MDKVQLLAAVPVLSVADISKSTAFYQDKLGFKRQFEVGDYAGFERGPFVLHLDGTNEEFSARPTCCRFHIKGVDALYTEIEPLGVVKTDEQLETRPHAMRQFSILDLDGNRITFAEPVTT